MKLLDKCQSCKETKWFIRKRKYNAKGVGTITSQSMLCRKCYKNIQKMLKSI